MMLVFLRFHSANVYYLCLLQTTYENTVPELVCQVLDVIGLYVAWIDINLIANDRIVLVLIRYLKMSLLRESACECVTEIVHKGMEPDAKVRMLTLTSMSYHI